MKKIILMTLLVSALLSGCRFGGDNDTTGTTAPSTEATQPSTQPSTQPTQESTDAQPLGQAETKAAEILTKIWGVFGEEERFAAYGGTVEHSVSDAPGDLDMSNTEELTTRYLLPEDQLSQVTEGASLVHMMNNNIFTGVAWKLAEGADIQTVSKAVQENFRKTQWVCGQPERMIMAEVDGHLLMVYGAEDVVNSFRNHMTTVFPEAKVLINEVVTA